MKSLLIALALFSLLGFVSGANAAEAKTHKHKGTFVKFADGVLTYKGAKEPHKEHTIKVTEKTTVTLDDKEVKLADLKEGQYLTIITDDTDKTTATSIVASTTAPTKK